MINKSKIRISQKYMNLLFNNCHLTGDGYSQFSQDIDLVNFQFCNIAGFRYNLHKIVDLNEELNNKDKIHSLISKNDFTILFFIGILEVIPICNN